MITRPPAKKPPITIPQPSSKTSQPQFNSPKRKRVASNPIDMIPPTPPSSSPSSGSGHSLSSFPRPPSKIDTAIPWQGIEPTSTYLDFDGEEEGSENGSGEKQNGERSPRTKVAYNFQGLRLDSGGSIARLTSGPSYIPIITSKEKEDVYVEVVRKRVKIAGEKRETGFNGNVGEVPETPEYTRFRAEEKGRRFAVVIGRERVNGGVSPQVGMSARGVVLGNEVDPVVFKGSAVDTGRGEKGKGLARAYPSINRLAESKSRKGKRAGTPPLGELGEEGESKAVDEERAALTWHDDEITGHDPDDPDDDGEGINGIGFKPTPAEAYVRAQKRRAQMAEYRNREAREARKMRSERRRGSEMSKASSKEEQETARRVRFMEAEVKSIISVDREKIVLEF